MFCFGFPDLYNPCLAVNLSCQCKWSSIAFPEGLLFSGYFDFCHIQEGGVGFFWFLAIENIVESVIYC